MSADFRLKQHLSLSPNATVKNLVPESLDTVPPREDWKVGKIWFNSTIGRFQSVFVKIDESTNLPVSPTELEVGVLGEDDISKTKISYSFKKLMGKEHSLTSKKWFEEEDGIVLYQHAKEVWVDRIAASPLDADIRFVKAYTDFAIKEDTTVLGRKAFYMRDTNGSRIKGFIPRSYGVEYAVKVKINNTLISPSHSSNYIFDYANGILTFETTPPAGVVTVDVYQYVGRSFSQYLDAEYNSVARGILGLDTPTTEYIIQHNMSTFDVDVIIYVFDEVDGVNYWKKDVVPLILMDENRVKIELTEEHPIRFIIKSYEMPDL